jgi:hypothetical protein
LKLRIFRYGFTQMDTGEEEEIMLPFITITQWKKS